MRYTILTVFLTLGVIGGLAAGCSRMHDRHHAHRKHFEQHVADICVQAALRADKPEAKQ